MEYERYVKQALPKQKLMLTLYSTARLTDLEMGDVFARRSARVKFRYLLVTPERAGKGAEPSEDEVKRYYQEHAGEFELPVTAVVSYVHFPTAASPSDSAASLQEVRGIHEELRAGADFEKLARQVSQDQQTAEQGGLLGWIKRGEVVKVFEDAAFSLKKGQISEPVLSEYGWHIIKLNDKKADSVKVSHILIRVDSSSETVDRARESAVLFREDVEEMDLASATVPHGVELLTTPPFSGRGNFIPTIGYSRVIKDFAFDSRPGDLSRVLATGLGFYVVRLDSIAERHVPSFESIRDSVTVLARKEKNLTQAVAVADSARDLLSSGLSMSRVADRLNLEYGTTRELSFANALPEYPIELLGAASVLADNETSNPIKTEKGCYIVEMLEKTEPNLEEFEKESSALANNLIDAKQRRIVDQWLAMLREKSDIRDYRGEVYR
jgi:peptidyl-prolyl cis-trans isomerase D